MRDMTETELEAIYDNRECPFCGEEGYYPGPRGGMMMNIKFKCGGEVNVVDPECWGGYVPRVGQVLKEPPGYVPKESKVISLEIYAKARKACEECLPPTMSKKEILKEVLIRLFIVLGISYGGWFLLETFWK
jgi:hypothetical protein